MKPIGKINIPGAVWTALLIAAGIVLQANFADAPWYGAAIIVILAVAKTISTTSLSTVRDALEREDHAVKSPPAQEAPRRSIGQRTPPIPKSAVIRELFLG